MYHILYINIYEYKDPVRARAGLSGSIGLTGEPCPILSVKAPLRYRIMNMVEVDRLTDTPAALITVIVGSSKEANCKLYHILS